MVGGRYTRGEVLFLLSLTHEQALEMDAFPRDSCAGLSEDKEKKSPSAEAQLPVLVRWQDVQRAKRQVVADKEALAIVQLRVAGISEHEIARLSGRDRMAVRRKWHATLGEIIDRLGGPEPRDTGALSRVSACIKCGNHPRVRLAAKLRRIRGGWKEIEPERQSSVCEHCLAPEFQPRILRKEAVAA